METNSEKKRGIGKGLGCLWGCVLMIFLVGGVGVWFVREGIIGNMPDLSDLQNPISKSASRLYTDDGVLMGTWSYARENRVMVPYDSIPQNMVNALVAVEDERFYEHSGIDYRALGRAIVKTLIGGDKSAGGGSTITQQLAKQLYTDVEHDFVKRMMQKPLEWYIAVELEKYYTKEEIIAMYLNYFDFINNAVGVRNAALTYFGKAVYDLSLPECATLVGMCKNPSYFNPMRFPERSKGRRDLILAKMAEQGYITEEECSEAQQSPLDVSRFHVTSHTDGIAPYFREHLRQIMMAGRPEREDYASWQSQKYYDDSLAWETDPLYGWCNKNTKKDGSYYNIYTDGLKIFTTIDSRMQKMAEEALHKHVAQYLQPAFDGVVKGRRNGPYMSLSAAQVDKLLLREMRRSERWRVLKEAGWEEDEIINNFNTPTEMSLFSYKGEYETKMTPRDSIMYYKAFLRCATMAMNPHNGYVRAYVPGLDFKHFQYDNCLGGGRRQVGSTMKPMLYSLAMMNDYTPCDMAPITQQVFGDWRPRGGVGSGSLPLRTALATSNNQASAWLMSKLNPYNLVKLLHEMGIGTQEIEPTLALCLGPCDISVGEMCSAYTTFANQGIRVAPQLVTRIEDAEGNVVATFIPRLNEIMSPEQAYQMISMMKDVINIGTGRGVRYSYGIEAETAGKTGTTNSHADAWFMGVVPNLVVATWVGGDDRDIHFNSMAFGQGARAALPVYGIFMKKVYAKGRELGVTTSDVFEQPENFEMCPDVLEGLGLASDAFPDFESEEGNYSDQDYYGPSGIDESFQ